MVCDFHEDLDRGLMAEEKFRTLFPRLEKSTVKEYDFTFLDKKIELKTEFRTMEETPNICFEMISNTTKGTLGGPFQSQSHGVDFFICFYIKNNKYFIFEVDELCTWIKENYKRYGPQLKPNKGYYTKYVLIPRDDIMAIEYFHKKSHNINLHEI